MIKKASVLALVICLFLGLLSPSLAQAQGGIKILDSSTQVEFPSRLSFNLSARSPATCAVLADESLNNHGGEGVHVAYNDGHVEWVSEPDSRQPDRWYPSGTKISWQAMNIQTYVWVYYDLVDGIYTVP